MTSTHTLTCYLHDKEISIALQFAIAHINKCPMVHTHPVQLLIITNCSLVYKETIICQLNKLLLNR